MPFSFSHNYRDQLIFDDDKLSEDSRLTYLMCQSMLLSLI